MTTVTSAGNQVSMQNHVIELNYVCMSTFRLPTSTSVSVVFVHEIKTLLLRQNRCQSVYVLYFTVYVYVRVHCIQNICVCSIVHCTALRALMM